MIIATVKGLVSNYNWMQWMGKEYLLKEVNDKAGDVYAEKLICWIRLYLLVLSLCND